MRHFICLFTALVLCVNAFASSAWASSCINIGTQTSDINIVAMDHTDCDMENEQQDERKSCTDCCDGLCLCLEYSSQQILNLNIADSHNQDIIRPTVDKYELYDYLSITAEPPYKPPIHSA